MFRFGAIRVDQAARRMLSGGRSVFLRNKEFCLLNYFVENAGRVISRTQILEDVWDQNIFCPTNTVDVHVSSLRKKLGLFSCAPVIRTIHCVGYIFELPSPNY